MTTKLKADFTTLASGRTVEDKLTGLVDAADYGADPGNTASENTTAINLAIQAAVSGFVIVPVGVAYTEASLVLTPNITLVVFGSDGVVTFLSPDTGDTPTSKSGIAVKQQGTNGVLLRAVDFGVSAEPFLQVVDLTNGDIAAVNTKFIELDEITAPANPSADKARLYTKDDGSGNTQLIVQFPTGSAIALATQGRSSNLRGSVVYDPASIADGTGVTTTVSVAGAALGDFVLVSFSLDLQGIILTGYVSAAGTVSVRFQNETGDAINLESGTITAVVIRNY